VILQQTNYTLIKCSIYDEKMFGNLKIFEHNFLMMFDFLGLYQKIPDNFLSSL
jgi:hypothetical protein